MQLDTAWFEAVSRMHDGYGTGNQGAGRRMTDEDRAQIDRMLDKGVAKREITRRTGWALKSIQRYAKRRQA